MDLHPQVSELRNRIRKANENAARAGCGVYLQIVIYRSDVDQVMAQSIGQAVEEPWASVMSGNGRRRVAGTISHVPSR